MKTMKILPRHGRYLIFIAVLLGAFFSEVYYGKKLEKGKQTQVVIRPESEVGLIS